LLPVQGEVAKKIITLAGDNCSAKEVIIVVQEAVERIQGSFSSESDEDEEEGNTLSLVSQLCTLVSLYSSCKFTFQLIICSSMLSNLLQPFLG
jgi:hypothetical protein